MYNQEVLGFSEVVHWLDAAYAEDTAQWSKHANICLTAHKMNILILFLDTKSIVKTQKYARVVEVFRSAIDKVLRSHNLRIVPVIYPVKKVGHFGDETERLEEILGFNAENTNLPLIGLIHGFTKKQIFFNHAIMDVDAFIPDLVGFWAVYQVLKSDLQYKKEQIEDLNKKIAQNTNQDELQYLEL